MIKVILSIVFVAAMSAAIACEKDETVEKPLKFSDVFGRTLVVPSRVELKQTPAEIFANMAVNGRDPIRKMKIPSLSLLDNLEMRD